MSCDVVLLTGAGGNLGGQLADYLAARSWKLRALVRDAGSQPGAHFERVLDWPTAKSDPDSLRELLTGVSTVVHLASSQASNPQEQQDAHLSMPDALLAAGAISGLKQFIALSSVKAIAGEYDSARLRVDHVPKPNSVYGEYKLAAEELVRRHPANSCVSSFILRLPMVYSPNAIGNFALLRKMARWGLPLPVATDNRRSVLFAENLFGFIEQLLSQVNAPGNVIVHLADEHALSTHDFFALIAAAEGVTGRSIVLSSAWAERLAGLPVLGGLATRLLGSLELDTVSAQRYGDWQLPFDTATGVAAAVRGSKKAD